MLGKTISILISNNSFAKYKIKKANMILLDNIVNKSVNKPIRDSLEMVNRKRDKNFIRKGIRISENT